MYLLQYLVDEIGLCLYIVSLVVLIKTWIYINMPNLIIIFCVVARIPKRQAVKENSVNGIIIVQVLSSLNVNRNPIFPCAADSQKRESMHAAWSFNARNIAAVDVAHCTRRWIIKISIKHEIVNAITWNALPKEFIRVSLVFFFFISASRSLPRFSFSFYATALLWFALYTRSPRSYKSCFCSIRITDFNNTCFWKCMQLLDIYRASVCNRG